MGGLTQKGQALVEFTLFIVFLLLLIGGVLDLARALVFRSMLSDAAEEGVAYGAIYPTDQEGIRRRVLHSETLLAGNADKIDVTIIVPSNPCAGDTIEVDAQMTLPLLFPFSTLIVPEGQIQIRGDARHTIVRPPCSP